jgi:hypothetical protein
MRLLVCGGRDYDSLGEVIRVLDLYHHGEPGQTIEEMCHGDAPGADSLAQMYSDYRGVPCRRYPANWDLHKNAAGPIRNREMFNDFKPDLVVAFPGGKGTADMISVARKAHCPVHVVSKYPDLFEETA